MEVNVDGKRGFVKDELKYENGTIKTHHLYLKGLHYPVMNVIRFLDHDAVPTPPACPDFGRDRTEFDSSFDAGYGSLNRTHILIKVL